MSEIFDPEIHAAGPDGNPTLNKDGSFRKKRKDAGRAAKSAPAAGKSSGKTDARSRHYKSVHDLLIVPAGLLALVDPVDGYCATELTPMWADAIADVAVEQPQLAAVLDKLSGVGAVGSLVGAALVTAMQFGTNHGKVPPHIGAMFGAKPRTEIEQLLTQRGERLAAQQKQAAAQDAEDAVMAQQIAEARAAGRYADAVPA